MATTVKSDTGGKAPEIQLVKAENSMTKAERIKADIDAAFVSGDADKLLELRQIAYATKLLWSGVCSHFDKQFDQINFFGHGSELKGSKPVTKKNDDGTETQVYPVVTRIREKNENVGRPAKKKADNPLVNSEY